MFRRSYVQKLLCSGAHIFRKSAKTALQEETQGQHHVMSAHDISPIDKHWLNVVSMREESDKK